MMPLGLIWLALGGWTLVLLGRGRRHEGLVTAAFWVALGLAGNVPLGSALLGWLERPFTGMQPLAAGPFDAIAVLGGGVREGPVGRPEVACAGGRVVLAAEMVHAGRTRLLVLTGPILHRPDGSRLDDARLERQLLEHLGVSGRCLLALPGPRTTAEEVSALSVLVQKNGWKRVGLITSAWHMRRALALCARVGLRVQPLPTDFRGGLTHRGMRNVIPQAAGLFAVQHAVWELLGGLMARAPGAIGGRLRSGSAGVAPPQMRERNAPRRAAGGEGYGAWETARRGIEPDAQHRREEDPPSRTRNNLAPIVHGALNTVCASRVARGKGP